MNFLSLRGCLVLPSPLTMPPLKEKDRVEDTEAPQQHIFFFLTSACMYNRAMVHCLKGIWILLISLKARGNMEDATAGSIDFGSFFITH